VPTGLLPPSARAQFVLNLELPAGASEAETARVARRLARYLADGEENPEITGSVVYVGQGGPRFFLALSPLDPAPHVAFGVVNTRESGDVAAVRRRIEHFAAAQLPEANCWTELLFLGSSQPGTLEIRLEGTSLEALHEAGRDVADLFRAVPGTRDVRSDWANPVLELNIEIDQERARHAGVSPVQLAQTLEATFEGVDITGLREGDRTIPVVLRARPDDRDTIEKLWEVSVQSESGVPVPLIQLADLGGELQPAVIRRHDQSRALTISGVNPALTAQQLLDELRPRLDALPLPPGHAWEADGEVQASADANAALFEFMPQCLAGIVLILLWQFNSLRRTAIILLTIPLVLIGASLGLNLTGGTLDFNAMLGLFSLAGIIINNGIVLIDRIDEERAGGLSVADAIVAAALTRFRPILMTTLTTILGLVPLHLFGGELWYAMTVVMIFGLGIGTLLTLGVVPAFYAAMFREVPPRAMPAVAAP
jgi:multidrug efflux pump subunit AcrB